MAAAHKTITFGGGGNTGAGQSINYTRLSTGFLNRIESGISFDDATRTFKVEQINPPPNDKYKIFIFGKQIWKQEETIQIDDETDLYYIYFDSLAQIRVSTTIWDFSNTVQIACVYWNKDDGESILYDERHLINMDWATQEVFHSSFGLLYANGFDMSGYAENVDTDDALTVGISNGQLNNQDIKMLITHAGVPSEIWEQILVDPASIPTIRRVGSDTWHRDPVTSFPYRTYTPGSRLAYNSINAGNWSQQETPDESYIAYWICATGSVDYPIISIQGQRSDVTFDGAALVNTLSNLDLSYPPFPSLKALYRIILKTSDSFNGSMKAKIIDIQDVRSQFASGGSAGGSGISAFTGLVDTPGTYTGEENASLHVNDVEDGISFRKPGSVVVEVDTGLALGKVMTLPNMPVIKSERITWNGLMLIPGADYDYTVSGNQVLFNDDLVLTVNDSLMVNYDY